MVPIKYGADVGVESSEIWALRNFYSNLSPLNHISDPRINTLVEIKPEGNKKVGLVLANTKDYDFIFNELS